MCALAPNKNIVNGLIKPAHTKVFFFVVLLISFSFNDLSAQATKQDSVKVNNVDTLPKEQFSDELDSRVTYHADDSTVTLVDEGRVLFYGKAKVVYEGVEMEADVIEIDYTKNTMLAYGRKDSSGKLVGTPLFKEGSQEPTGAEKIMYNFKTGKGKIFNALTRQGDFLVIGSEIKKDSTDIVYMKNMRCIPCEEADARTVFVASKAKIIPDDKIVTGPVYLEVGGVPTPLGLPFGYFPNTKKQHNGLLLPTYNNSQQLGFYLQNLGYYWGISDKTDMIIRTDLYANGSFGLNTTNNYKALYKSSGSLYLSYNRYNIGDPDVKSSYYHTQAYTVRWRHTQDNRKNPSVSFNADVNYTSNQQTKRLTAASTDQFLQSQFISSINFTKSFKASSLSFYARQEQNTQTKLTTLNLPALTYYKNAFNPLRNPTHVRQNAIDKIQMSYRVEGINTLQGYDSLLLKGDWRNNIKYGVRQSVPISTSFNLLKYITVTPLLDLSAIIGGNTVEKTYGKVALPNDLLRDSLLTTTVRKPSLAYSGQFSTTFNTKVYFDYMYKKGKVKQIRHLMIPSISYNYRPDFGAEQFGYWKQVQKDTMGNKAYYSVFESSVYNGPAMGKSNSLSLRINNNVEAKLKQLTDTGVTFRKLKLIEDLQVGGDYNFAADSFNLSLLSMTARTTLFKIVSVNIGSSFDAYAWDHTQNRRIRDYAYNHGEGIARMVNSFVALSSNITSEQIATAKKKRKQAKTGAGIERESFNEQLADKKLAWRISVNYRVDFTNSDDRKIQPAQTLQLGSDFMPTKFWKVGISSGYNFATQKVSNTRFNVTRDLKCWVAMFEWVPFGVNKSYSVGINLKSAMLNDLKLKRNRQWFDNLN